MSYKRFVEDIKQHKTAILISLGLFSCFILGVGIGEESGFRQGVQMAGQIAEDVKCGMVTVGFWDKLDNTISFSAVAKLSILLFGIGQIFRIRF